MKSKFLLLTICILINSCSKDTDKNTTQDFEYVKSEKFFYVDSYEFEQNNKLIKLKPLECFRDNDENLCLNWNSYIELKGNFIYTYIYFKKEDGNLIHSDLNTTIWPIRQDPDDLNQIIIDDPFSDETPLKILNGKLSFDNSLTFNGAKIFVNASNK